MNSLTLDQLTVFVMIVAEGSFAAAARRLDRAQSAITYAIQKLEEQSGVTLFDRSSYRPTLTEAGRALLPRAQRILHDVSDFRLQAKGLVTGIEAELSLVVDAYTPSALIAAALKAFNEAFPLVQIRVSTEFFDAAANALLDGWADLGLLIEPTPLSSDFERVFCDEISLVAVAAPDHPLAALERSFDPELLRDHVQLVLSTRMEPKDRRDYGVHAMRHWRITDLHTKHALLLAGLGWGSMPRSMVTQDLATGRLIELQPSRWEGSDRMPRFPLVVAHRRDKALGPAGRWLVQQLKTASNSASHPAPDRTRP